MTEFTAQLEVDRLKQITGREASMIGCQHVDCPWRVIVLAEVSASQAVRVVVALGGRAYINAKGEVASWCPDHPEGLEVPAGAPTP